MIFCSNCRIKEKLDLLKTRVPFVDPRTNTASFLEAVLQYIDALQVRGLSLNL